MLPEWRDAELVYLSAARTVMKFGFPSPGASPDATATGRACYQEIAGLVPLQDGPVADPQAAFPGAMEATRTVKQHALDAGADMVGITRVDPHYVYQDEHLPHRYAIVLAAAMDYEEILQVPRPQGNEEFLRVYQRLARLSVDLASWIRGRGFPARAHTLCREQLAMLPHAYAAGLGELGKHGSLINRKMGCSFRVAVVTTDLDLVPDQPVSEGIDHFCAGCDMCVRYCPGDAIHHQKETVRGTTRWVVDTEKCAPFFSTYHACGICLQVCPWNAHAFQAKYKHRYVQTIKAIDVDAMRTTLNEGLIEPWVMVPTPKIDIPTAPNRI